MPYAREYVIRRLREQFFQWAHHQGQRRPELVADIGEEQRLGTIDLGQSLGAPALVFIGLRICQLAAISPAASVRKPRYVSSNFLNGLRPAIRTP